MSDLLIEIRKGRKVIRVEKIPDPRVNWCRIFNADDGMQEKGIQAYPVSSDTRRAMSKSREA